MREQTVYRVDTSGEEDVLILPPTYHVAGDDSESLVYTDFGADFLARLEEMNFPTTVLQLDLQSPELQKLLTFSSRKESHRRGAEPGNV